MEISDVKALCDDVKAQVQKAVVGQNDAVDLMLISLLSDGHILLEGVPGTAKTLLAQAFAGSLALQFGRIQFNARSDARDVLGTKSVHATPVHVHRSRADLYPASAADEINPAHRPDQAALLEPC